MIIELIQFVWLLVNKAFVRSSTVYVEYSNIIERITKQFVIAFNNTTVRLESSNATDERLCCPSIGVIHLGNAFGICLSRKRFFFTASHRLTLNVLSLCLLDACMERFVHTHWNRNVVADNVRQTNFHSYTAPHCAALIAISLKFIHSVGREFFYFDSKSTLYSEMFAMFCAIL